jgi:RHS repeat-associated protein
MNPPSGEFKEDTAMLPPTSERSGFLGRRRWVVHWICIAALSASSLQAQDNQNEKRGFNAESVYSVGEIDTVSLFNGGLSMVIPIGGRYPLSTDTSYGFQLVYNSKLWDYRTVLVSIPSGFERIAIPTRVTNAGLGWTFNPGYFLEENGASDVIHEWNHSQYVGPDGSQHYFYDQLHRGENDGDPDVWYSRDNTYLRLKKLNASLYQIEFPDGEIHQFGYQLFDPTTQWSKWYLTRIEDRYGNWMSISYGARQSTWDWTITDKHGRSHSVTLTYHSDVDDYYVTSVNLEGFDGTPASYTFAYQPDNIEQGCGATYPMEGVDVRFLTSLTLPNGESYTMTEGGTHRYWTFCGGGSRESGAIMGIRLPTRGQIEWDYSKFVLPHYFQAGSNAAPATVDVRGVRQRRTLDEAGNVLGRWNYRRELIPPPPYNTGIPGLPRGREQRVHVEDPLGHCTTHYFDANPGYTNPSEDSNPIPGWSYSLPFSWQEPQSGGHHLSTQVWDGTDGVGHCGGTLLRSSYVLYEHDEVPLPTSTPEGRLFDALHESNRRVKSRRTVYDDDGGTFAETVFGDFDGVGHYRTSTTGGDFDAGNVRETVTEFNPGLGTYTVDQVTNTTTGDFTPPATTDPWILGTFERQTMTEGESAISTSCFDANGFLTRRRMLAGASEGSHDVLAVRVPDADGNVAFERFYGGDLQTVGTASNLCALSLPSAPAYEIEHQYAYGSRKLSRYLEGSVPVPFKSLDLDVDQSTGLAAASRDTAGIETTFIYDTLGRLTDERPEAGHGAWVEYTYVNATLTDKARVEIAQRPNGGGASLAESQVIYDRLGRVFQEKTELPSGQFGARETLYNARGDRDSVSEVELGTPTHKMEYSEYDPFGRPGRVRPADGSAHDVVMSYAGVRQVSRTRQVATGAGGVETPSTTTEIYDRQGRLYRVVEPGTGTQTTYGHDEGGRLASVSMAGPVTQTRLFDYDHFGFLRSETHPEVGNSGNGAVTYGNYDARGHAGRMSDDGRTLDYAYDAAERLLTVTSTAEGLMKQFIYDTAASHGLGKVHQAIRHNRLGGTSDYVVTETYDYAGIGGRVSSVLTTSSVNDLEFLVSQTYDPLGRVEDLVYPSCQGSPDCPLEPFTVRNTYQAHDLVAVGIPSNPTAGAAITYHPNRMWSTLTYGNGVVTTQQNDPDGMRRPRRISVSGVGEGVPFDTGLYAYDGAGNVKATGSDSFVYDPLSRLTESAVRGWEQDFVYDAFGNVTRVDTTPPGEPQEIRNIAVSASTNRLSGHGYDGAGNLTTFTGVWTHEVDPLNMPILRESPPGVSQWAAIYTAADERLATSDESTGQPVQHWTLRSPSGQILRDFRYGAPVSGEPVFCDGFESGDTSGWESTTGVTGEPFRATKGTSCVVGDPEWIVYDSYVYRDGALLAEINQGDLRFYHLDHLGSVRQLTDAEADVVASYDYLPYGKEVHSSTAPLQFTGHERDSHLPGDEDNLDYMHARYYSPYFGKFLSLDPIDSARPSRPQSWNMYGYAINNPILYVDPDGEEAKVYDGGIVIDRGILHDRLIYWGENAQEMADDYNRTHTVKGLLTTLAVFVGIVEASGGEDSSFEEQETLTDEDEDEDRPARQKGERWKSDDDPLQQLDEIERAQDKARKSGKPDKIHNIDKSQQRKDHHLRRIKRLKDVEEDH